MKLQPEELETHGYVLMDRLDHKEIISFVREYLKKTTVYSMMYMAFNLLFFGIIVYQMLVQVKSGPLSLGDAVAQVSYGMAIAFLLIPLHEWIHVLAYKSQGAVNTSYDANLKKFYFLAVADRFVADRREFTIVALAPFVVITLIGLVAVMMVAPVWGITVWGVLLTHTAFCSGDFGLLSYFAFHRHRDVVTYDDRAGKMSYFLGRGHPVRSGE